MQSVASTTASAVQLSGPSQPALTVAHPVSPAEPSTGQINPSATQVDSAISAANVALKQVTNDLEFARDTETGKIVVRVIDASTQQVIRQFPSDEMLAIARALDRFESVLIKEKA